MEIWITADTHFNHKNIIEYCNRPFKNIDEMNETIIENWNKFINKDDVIFHLGDVGFGKFEQLKPIIDKLNGKKYLIQGNHDRLNKNYYRELGFEWIKSKHIMILSEIKLILLHRPPLWNNNIDNSFLYIYGHTHGKSSNTKNKIDIGTDTNNFKPYNMTDLILNYKKNGFSMI